MTAIPTKWVTIDVKWGEAMKHLWSPNHETLKFHDSEADARLHAANDIQEGSTMIAVLEVKTLFVAKAIEFDEVA